MLRCVDWIQLAHDKVQWRAIENTDEAVGEELIDQLNDYELLKKDHAPRSKLVN
jgi:hypothetical protein